MSDELISRSELIAKIKPPAEDDFDHMIPLGNVRQMLLNFANSVPTVEAVPVRHGHWILNPVTSTYRCSECWGGVNVIRENFCPKCGADMREDNA